VKTIEHWINGVATKAGSTRKAPVYNPATGQQQASVLLAESSTEDTAVAAATNAFESWSGTSRAPELAYRRNAHSARVGVRAR